MDSQHRHDLQDNWLAQKLADGIETIKPHLPMIVLGFVAAMVGTVALNSYRGSASKSEEVAWQSYSIAIDRTSTDRAMLALEQVSNDHGDSPAATWADATWADAQLMMASRQYLSNRTSANEALDKATEKYETLLADSGAGDLVHQRARFGLARAKDLRGEVDEARKLYEQVDGAFKEIAEARAKELDEQRVIDAAKWLATAEATRRPPGFGALGAGAATDQPDATPDPLALPGEEPSGDESFSDLLKRIQDAGAEEDTEENAEASAQDDEALMEDEPTDPAEAQPADDTPASGDATIDDAKPESSDEASSAEKEE